MQYQELLPLSPEQLEVNDYLCNQLRARNVEGGAYSSSTEGAAALLLEVPHRVARLTCLALMYVFRPSNCLADKGWLCSSGVDYLTREQGDSIGRSILILNVPVIVEIEHLLASTFFRTADSVVQAARYANLLHSVLDADTNEILVKGLLRLLSDRPIHPLSIETTITDCSRYVIDQRKDLSARQN